MDLKKGAAARILTETGRSFNPLPKRAIYMAKTNNSSKAPTFFQDENFDTHFKVFHELMSNKVFEILLVASPYDAYILEEDGSLASKIINEYHGLNLSRPPRLTKVSTAANALCALGEKHFDLVIAMPHLDDMDPFELGRAIKGSKPDLPVVLLAHSISGLFPMPETKDSTGIDQIYVWSGDADLLLAIVKNVEDRHNVDQSRSMLPDKGRLEVV